MIEVAKNVDNRLSLAQTTTIWYVMIDTILFHYQKDSA